MAFGQFGRGVQQAGSNIARMLMWNARMKMRERLMDKRLQARQDMMNQRMTLQALRDLSRAGRGMPVGMRDRILSGSGAAMPDRLTQDYMGGGGLEDMYQTIAEMEDQQRQYRQQMKTGRKAFARWLKNAAAMTEKQFKLDQEEAMLADLKKRSGASPDAAQSLFGSMRRSEKARRNLQFDLKELQKEGVALFGQLSQLGIDPEKIKEGPQIQEFLGGGQLDPDFMEGLGAPYEQTFDAGAGPEGGPTSITGQTVPFAGGRGEPLIQGPYESEDHPSLNYMHTPLIDVLRRQVPAMR